MNPDFILNTDVADSIQGHVGPNTKQVITTLDAWPFSNPRLKLAGYCFLCVDQFGNHYHKTRAVLFDGELYDHDEYIKPSMMMRTGGGFADFEDKSAKSKLRITQDLMNELAENGAIALGRANQEILRQRSLSQNPVALETQDITHAANLLEDNLKAAKLAAGETVQDEKLPGGFEPLKPEPTPVLPNVGQDPTADSMHSTAHNMHHHTKSAHDHNAAHGVAATHSGKSGNKLHDAGMGKTGLENMQGGATGTPKPSAYKAGKSHAHSNGS